MKPQMRWSTRAELPGFEKDQIEISVNDGRLTVSGERKFSEEKDTKYHQVERSYGSFYHSFRLPTSADSEKISRQSEERFAHAEASQEEGSQAAPD